MRKNLSRHTMGMLTLICLLAAMPTSGFAAQDNASPRQSSASVPAQNTPIDIKTALPGSTLSVNTANPSTSSNEVELLTKPVNVSVDQSTLEIGQKASLQLSFGERVTNLTIEPSDEKASYYLFGAPESIGDHAWKVPMQILVSGTYDLNDLRIYAVDENGQKTAYYGDSKPVTVLEPKAEMAEPKDYTGLLNAKLGWKRPAQLAATALIVLAVLIALLIWFLKYVRRKKPEILHAQVPALPPLQELRVAFEPLANLVVFNTRGVEAHYTELSFALRRYFERKYQMPALEMSDEEMRVYLKREMSMQSFTSILMTVFDQAGLAKFAKFSISEDDTRNDISKVQSFIQMEEENERQRELIHAGAAHNKNGSEAA